MNHSVSVLVRWILLTLLLFGTTQAQAVELADQAQVAAALAAFHAYAEAYQRGDYAAQYRLVHTRIRHYKPQKRWIKAMRKSLRVNGELLEFKILAVGAVTPEQIPCTEMGHCFRKDMQTVMIAMDSRYAKVGARDKEYVVMANSSEGWRVGGGTFLNRPVGETMVILDRRDERRYKYQRN